MTDTQTSSRGGIIAWVGIASSVLTVTLTMFNAYTKNHIDAAELQLKESQQRLDAQLKERSTSVEESKERTRRYEFVHTLLPDLLAKEAPKNELTINLIRLALTDEEATKLFTGFSQSASEELQSAGSTAITIINKEKNNLQIASDKEREGFQELINGNYGQAVVAFQAAESAYPSYHQVYELSRLLKARKEDLSDSSKRKAVLQQIVANYAYGAPSDLLEQLQRMANEKR